ncbi:flavodoxin domain-containing protein [Oceanivirga salmonicida]|uniref:flavodoxin domain-containing protein n=1 Tax=Oceanivirga salmonicida TaxID=1769291 RepID=UPI0018CC7223|nr:flavodoxin domain-containing protein [Oceanivirga salmonicida]
MKKIAIIYVSYHHNNTKKIVDIISKELNAKILTVDEAKNFDFSDYDMIGFASGIYGGKIHKILSKFIDETTNLPKTVFTILTSGSGNIKYSEKFAESLT